MYSAANNNSRLQKGKSMSKIAAFVYYFGEPCKNSLSFSQLVFSSYEIKGLTFKLSSHDMHNPYVQSGLSLGSLCVSGRWGGKSTQSACARLIRE